MALTRADEALLSLLRAFAGSLLEGFQPTGQTLRTVDGFCALVLLSALTKRPLRRLEPFTNVLDPLGDVVFVRLQRLGRKAAADDGLRVLHLVAQPVVADGARGLGQPA